MPPRIWPESTKEKNEAEQILFDALYAALSPKDASLTNMRLTDREEGHIEIDLIALIHNLGVVVFETKGGSVSYNGETFVQSDRRGARPIASHDQVLKNLYVFKRFLRDRWSYGNIKTEWIIAFSLSLGHPPKSSAPPSLLLPAQRSSTEPSPTQSAHTSAGLCNRSGPR
jgi:hypothetical protein